VPNVLNDVYGRTRRRDRVRGRLRHVATHMQRAPVLMRYGLGALFLVKWHLRRLDNDEILMEVNICVIDAIENGFGPFIRAQPASILPRRPRHTMNKNYWNFGRYEYLRCQIRYGSFFFFFFFGLD